MSSLRPGMPSSIYLASKAPQTQATSSLKPLLISCPLHLGRKDFSSLSLCAHLQYGDKLVPNSKVVLRTHPEATDEC